MRHIQEREDQMFLVLARVIGALVGLVIVAFIVITERFGLHLYPSGGSPWRRLVTPIVGALIAGYLLYRHFPEARGSGIPQTKTALFAGRGRSLCERSLAASSVPLQRWQAVSLWDVKAPPYI
jgi:CIC family chloride channel protein